MKGVVLYEAHAGRQGLRAYGDVVMNQSNAEKT